MHASHAQNTLSGDHIDGAEEMLASGRPDMALPMFLAIAQSDTASEVSLSRASLGAGMCHWQMGDDLSANKFWSRASNHAKAAGEAAKTYLAQAYSLRGSLYESWDELETALAFSRSSLEINKTLPDPPPGELAYGYNNIGAIYFGKCDWDKAIEYYTQSHRAYISDSLEVEAALPLTNLGLAWLRKEEFANAIECFRKAQAGVLEEGDPNLVGSLYNNWGLACVQTGKTDTAIALLQRVLQLEDAPMHQIASAQANLGFAYLRAQSPAEALPWLQKALGQSEGGLKAAKRAKVLLHLGETQLALGQAPAALQSTDEGICLLLGLPMDSIWTPGILLGPNRDARTLFQLLAARAATLSAMGKLSQASETYQWALQISDQMRQDLLARGSKLFLSSYVLPVLEAALENEWQLQATTFKQRPADFQQRMNLILSLFERNKALMLQEERQAAEALRTAGIPAPVLERERSLQSDIDFYAQKAFEARQAGNKVDLEKIERQIFEKNSALDKIRQTLDAQFPAIRQQKAQVFKADLAALQAYARSENILIVEYFWGKSAVYAFTMAPEGPRFLRLCGNIAVISQAARDLAASLANWSAILSDPAAAESVFQRSSKLLSDSLLAPVFGGKKPAELLCIPDGPLARIPLEALPMPGSPLSGGWVGFPYLIRQMEVRYAWSAALLLGPKPHLPSPKNKAVLALAPMSGDGFAGAAHEIQQLPGSQTELTAIAKHCEGQFWMGKMATKEAFLREAPQYAILHLALHGNLSPDASAFSNLSFLSDSAAVPLYAWEIERLQLPAEMVVLSACETGAGTLSRGEGVLSLGRSFISQGARSVITTLWKVEDKSAATLMDAYYAALAAGQGRGAALRQAKLDYLGQADDFTAHPAFWAGFVLMGDAGKIEFEPSGGGAWDWIWWAIGPMFAVGVWIWFRARLGKGENFGGKA